MSAWLFIAYSYWLVTRSIGSLYLCKPLTFKTLIMKHTNDPMYGLPSEMQIRHDRIVGYHAARHSLKHKLYLSAKMRSRSIRSQAYQGFLHYGARKRLIKACQMMACITPERRLVHPLSGSFFNFRLAFVTLTFPVDLTHDQEKHAPIVYLKPFLQILSRRFDVKNYVWRAELTTKNRLHFHLIIDQPINYIHLRNAWNRILRTNGLLTAYAKENGHFNPNSTDIRKVHSLKKALKYTSKYISKAKKVDRPLHCKVYDCSMFLKSQSWSSIHVGKAVFGELLGTLTGNEPGVLITERFCVIETKFCKVIDSLWCFIQREMVFWVTQMRIACGWIDPLLA